MNISSVSTGGLVANHDSAQQASVSVQPVRKSEPVEVKQVFDQPKVIQKEEVMKTVAKLNDFFDPIRTNLKFVFHEDLNEYYVTVINPLTDEVVREIPPKRILDMVAKMTEFIGVLVDEKA